MDPVTDIKALTEDASPPSRELLDAFDQFLNAFEQFKDANDERLAQIETRLSADVVTTEKMERINRALTEQKSALDALALGRQRPPLAAGPAPRAPREHEGAFDRYVRKGDAHELARFETKALSMQTGPEGGYLAPPELERAVDRLLAKSSPIRGIASVRQIGAASFRKPMNVTGIESGWVGETAARPQTDAPTLAVLEFPAMELYAMPAATQAMLDDAYVDVEAWLAEEVQAEFASQEGAAFVSGDGVNKPKGFLAYETVANAAWVWGKVGFVLSGAAGGFLADDPSDRLIDLVYAPRQIYRPNARWVMNRGLEAEIRKFKDAAGNYLWQPGAHAGDAATLLGYPIVEAEDMPALGAGSLSIAFGDFARFYLVVDRVGVRVLRDPYSAKPYVLFYTTKRVGGGVQNFEAVKLMKFAAA